MDFVAIDVETANANAASICQIGLASYSGNTIIEEWKSYVDPEDFFDPVNVSIHGINKNTVAGAPRLPEIYNAVLSRLKDRVVVCHTHFDRVAVHRACCRYKLPPPDCAWLDSAQVTRRTWSHFASRGYGLKSVCGFLGYEFIHHDALEDAKAAGRILIAAMEITGFSIKEWLARVKYPIDPSSCTDRTIVRQENSRGPLSGEVMVFTGALKIPRWKAVNLAYSIGCEVARSVTKRTTILVVGDRDVQRLANREKSSKQRKAEELIAQGQAIRILREFGFIELATLTLAGSGPDNGIQQTGVNL